MCRYQRRCAPDTHSLCWREVQSCSEVLYLSLSTTFLFLFPFPSTCRPHKHTQIHTPFSIYVDSLHLCSIIKDLVSPSNMEAVFSGDPRPCCCLTPASSQYSYQQFLNCLRRLCSDVAENSLCVCLRNQGPVRNSASKKVTSKILPLS